MYLTHKWNNEEMEKSVSTIFIFVEELSHQMYDNVMERKNIFYKAIHI